MIDDEAPGPEYGELGYRMVELRVERQMRWLLTLLTAYAVLLFVSLLTIALLLNAMR